MNRYAFAAKRHWPLLIGLNILIFGAAAANFLMTPKSWAANAELIIPNETSSLNADLGELGQLSNEALTYSQQLSPLKIVSSILSSDTVMEGVRARDPESEDFERLQAYKSLFEITPQSETTIIELSAEGSSPKISEQRLMALIEVFQQRLVALRTDEAQRRSEFALRELEAATDKLGSARSELANYQSDENIVDGGIQTAGLVETLGDLTNSRAQSIAQAQAERALSASLSGQLNLSTDQALDLLRLNENENYRFVQEKLSEVEANLIAEQAVFTDEHPTVEALLKQRDELAEQVNQYAFRVPDIEQIGGAEVTVGQGTSELIQQLVSATTKAIALEQQAEQLQFTIDQLNTDLLSLPAKQATLAALQEDYDLAQATYRGLSAQLQEAQLSAFGAYPVIQVLDQPTADLKPSNPNKKLIAAGAVLASLAATTALLLLLVSRDSLLSGEELLITDLEILGHLPKLRATAINANSEETLAQFQKIASAVSVMPILNRRILITSAGVGEGKTTVATGLASGLTTLGFKVLLMDGSFEKRDLSKTVSNQQRRPAQVKKIKSPQGLNISIIPLGPKLDCLTIDAHSEAEMAEVIAQGELEKIFSHAQRKGDYDYLVIDGASANANYAMPRITQAAGNVVMVTRPGLSKSYPFRESLEQISRCDARVIGVVVNAGDAPQRRMEDYAYNNIAYTSRDIDRDMSATNGRIAVGSLRQGADRGVGL